MAKGKRKRRSGHPTRTSPVPAPTPTEARPALSRRAIAFGVLVLLVAGISAFLVSGSDEAPEEQAGSNPDELLVPWVDDQGATPIVGSVDVNPADDSV